MTYDVFGKPNTKQSYGKITRLKKSKIGNTRMYTGREYDRGLKLYYNRARYYNPKLGRFISRDPIDIADNVNLYAYVGNNGVMFVDRLGLEKTLIIVFTGRTYDKFGEVDYNDTNLGLSRTVNRLRKDKNNKVKFYYSSATKMGSEKWDANKYINDNRKKYSRLAIIGHSLGADNAVELSKSLNNDGIRVDLLLSIDLQAYHDTTIVEDNVMYAKNYYQTHWNAISNGAKLTKYYSNNITEIENIKVNNTCDIKECVNGDKGDNIYHTTIDYHVSDQLINAINNIK